MSANRLDIDMPEGFPKRIHQALRAYHTRHTRDVLDDLLLAHKIRTEREMVILRLISNEILMSGLGRLKQAGDDEAAISFIAVSSIWRQPGRWPTA